MKAGECQTLEQRTSYTYFHLSSNSNPAVGRNQDILTSGSEATGYKRRMGIFSDAREHGNCFDQGIKCFCEIFLA